MRVVVADKSIPSDLLVDGVGLVATIITDANPGDVAAGGKVVAYRNDGERLEMTIATEGGSVTVSGRKIRGASGLVAFLGDATVKVEAWGLALEFKHKEVPVDAFARLDVGKAVSAVGLLASLGFSVAEQRGETVVLAGEVPGLGNVKIEVASPLAFSRDGDAVHLSVADRKMIARAIFKEFLKTLPGEEAMFLRRLANGQYAPVPRSLRVGADGEIYLGNARVLTVLEYLEDISDEFVIVKGRLITVVSGRSGMHPRWGPHNLHSIDEGAIITLITPETPDDGVNEVLSLVRKKNPDLLFFALARACITHESKCHYFVKLHAPELVGDVSDGKITIVGVDPVSKRVIVKTPYGTISVRNLRDALNFIESAGEPA